MWRPSTLRWNLHDLDWYSTKGLNIPSAQKDNHQFDDTYKVLKSLREERPYRNIFKRCLWVYYFNHWREQSVVGVQREVRDGQSLCRPRMFNAVPGIPN